MTSNMDNRNKNNKTSPATDPNLQDDVGTVSPPRRDAKSGVAFEHTDDALDEEKNMGELPSVTAPIEALGIPEWEKLEKKLVRRLDMTLMPMLWVLYLFNYLDRASIS